MSGADGLAHRRHRRQIVGQPVAPEPELEPGEAALVAQLHRLVRDRRGLLQPQPVAVVGRHGAGGPAQEHAQGHARGPGEGVPGGHVEPGRGDHGEPAIADEVQGAAGRVEQLDRRHRPAGEQLAQIVQHRHEVAHRPRQIGLEVAAAGDALLGLEVDQDQRPVGDGGDPRHDRPLQPEQHRPRADAPQRQRLHDRPPCRGPAGVRPLSHVYHEVGRCRPGSCVTRARGQPAVSHAGSNQRSAAPS